MPLDPMIANPATIQLNDPMEMYGKYLTNALMMDKMDYGRAKRVGAEMMGNALREGFDPTTKQVNRDKSREWLATNNGSRYIPEMDESFLKNDKLTEETAHQKAAAGKNNADAKLAVIKAFHEDLKAIPIPPQGGGTPEDAATAGKMYRRAKRRFTMNELIAPELLKWADGNTTKLADLMEEEGEVFDNEYKAGRAGDYLMSITEGFGPMSERDNKVIEQVGQNGEPPNQVIVPVRKHSFDNSVQQFAAKPHSPGVTVNVGGGDKYQEEAARLQARADAAEMAAAKNAPSKIEVLKRGLALVDEAYTGYWANVSGTAASALNVNPKAQRASQELGQILSTDMFGNIAALRQEGVALGSVTEKEFEQLRATVPKNTDHPDVIKAWMRRAIKLNEDVMARWGDRLEQLKQGKGTAPITQSGVMPPTSPRPRGAENPSNIFTDSDGDPIPAADIELLKKYRNDPKRRNQFDKAYGKPGLSTLILQGGGPTGQAPLP